MVPACFAGNRGASGGCPYTVFGVRRLAFLAASLVLLLPASAGAAKARIKAVAVTPTSVAPGDAIRVRVTVAGGKAGRMALLLSADARRGSGDQRVRSLKVPGRKGKRVLKASVDLQSAGSFRVLACLKKRCRASAPILVVAPSPGPPRCNRPPRSNRRRPRRRP